MQPWQNPARWVRVDNWWAKIPPLVAVVYAEALLRRAEPELVVSQLAGVLLSIFSVAAYGHVINDLFDLEADHQAGKPNAMARLGPLTRGVALVVPVVTGWLPWLWTGWGAGPALLLAVNYALPTCYSIPPVRLKERGLAGVLADTSGAHGIPTLFIVAAWHGRCACDADQEFWLGLTASASALAAGLRGILQHQLYDRLADLRAGVSTWATQLSPERLSRYLQSGVYPLEIVATGSYVWAVQRFAPGMAAVFVIFAIVELARVALDWQFRFHADQGEQEHYRPLSNNAFYELWWPTGLLGYLLAREPSLIPLAVVQGAAFWRGYVAELVDLGGLCRSLGDKARRAWTRTWWDPRIRAWHPRLWGEFACQLDRVGDANGEGLRITPYDGRTPGRSTAADALELSRQPLAIDAGKTYHLRFSARADLPSRVDYGVSLARHPWTGLGLARAVTIGPVWHTYEATFAASAACEEARVFWLFPGLAAQVEIRQWQFQESRDPHPWFVVDDPGGRAQQVAGSRAGNVRWLVTDTATVSDVVLRQTGHRVVRQGETGNRAWRLRFELWAERGGQLAASVKQAQPPWGNLGLEATWHLAPGWQTVEADWIPTADEPQACLELACGRMAGEWEIAGLTLEPEATDSPLVLESEPGHAGEVKRVADARRFTPQLRSNPTETSVRWTCPTLALSSERVYRLTVRARADAPRTITVDLVADRAPWPNLGLSASWQLDQAWREYLVEFAAVDAAEPVRLRLLAGASDVPFEISQWQWTASDDHAWWQLDVAPGARATLRPTAEIDGCRIEIHSTTATPSDLSVLRSGLTLSAGRWQELSFAARADAPRRAAVRVCRAEPPWDELAPAREVWLDPTPRRWSFGFPGPRQKTPARVQWVLGDSAVPGELWGVACDNRPAGEGWSLEPTQGAGAQFLEPIAPGAGQRLEFLESASGADPVRLTRPVGAVRGGAWYRLRLAARADAPRELLVRLCERASPWGLVADEQRWRVTDDWQTLVVDLQATRDEATVRCHLVWGSETSAVEIGEFTWSEIAESEAISLDCEPGYAAQLSECPHDPARWVLQNLSPRGGPAEAVRVQFGGSGGPDGGGISLETGERYRISWSVASTVERPVLVRICQPQEPWPLVAPEMHFTAGPDSRVVFADFVAEATTSTGRLHLCFGDSPATCEFARPVVERFAAPAPRWSLVGSGGTRAQLERIADAPSAVRVRTWGACESEGSARLSLGPLSVRPESPLRLTARLRGSAAGVAALTLAQTGPPWQVFTPQQPVPFTASETRLALDLWPQGTAGDAALVCRLPEQPGWLDVLDLSLGPLEPAAQWRVITGGGAEAHRLVEQGDSPDRVRVVTTVPGQSPFDALVDSPAVAVRQGQQYAVRGRWRAAGPRVVTVSLVDGAPPWSGLGLWQAWHVGTEWQTLVAYFTAGADSAEARLRVVLGADPAEIEWSDLRLDEVDTVPWRLDALEGAQAQLTLPDAEGRAERAIGVSIIEPGSETWHVQLELARLAVAAGTVYRLRFQGRARSVGRATCLLAQAHAPWQTLAKPAEIRWSEAWQSFECRLTATEAADQGRILLLLGGDVGEIEVREPVVTT